MRIRIQRSDMTAKTSYDFRRLEEKHHLLLPCRIEEEKETICMSFDLRKMQAFEEMKGEEKLAKLTALIRVAELEELYLTYEFSLEPENLYYDILGGIRVKRRDLVPPGQKDREKDFLRQYQALVGYLLGGFRPYEEYLYGDMSITKEKDVPANLLEPETVQEEKRVLSEYYVSLLEEEKKCTRKVESKKYEHLIAYRRISAFLLAVFAAATFYSFAWYMPRQEKFTEAEDAYARKDYTAMVDALKGFKVDDLGHFRKYMLATAYIQGQAVDTFSAKDKENILSKVTYQSNENVLDYWIHLGRLEIKEAEDLAMKLSDDQLLLYAYMHELRQLEEDGKLSGEEKSRRKQELLEEIERLAGNLGIS